MLLLVLILLGTSAWTFIRIMEETGGTFVYGLDDAYIHLEIARNIITNGTYGVFPDQISIASSSIVWPWILSLGFLLWGSASILPLLLNVLLGIGILWVSWRLLRNWDVPPVITTIVCIAELLLLPVLPLIFNGMESLLHGFLSLLLLGALRDLFDKGTPRAILPTAVLLALMMLVRYETLSLVAGTVVVLLLYRRLVDATKIGFAAVLPIFMAGFLYLAFGGSFFPSSIILKMGGDFQVQGIGSLTRYLNISQVGIEAWMMFRRIPAMLLVLGMLIFVMRESRTSVIAVVSVYAIAVVGYAYGVRMQYPANIRYEAYLAAPMIVLMGGLLWENRSRLTQVFRGKEGIVRGIIVVILLLPGLSATVYQSLNFTAKTVRPSVNIAEQQQQMAHFVERHYADSTICLNDIGSVAFYTDADIIDLAGLGTPSVTEAYREQRFTTAFIDSLTRARGARIAMVYDSWFKGRASLPAYWIRAGIWQIRESLICGDDEVSIYALDSASLPPLRKALQDFSDELPDRVIQAGIASP